MRTLIILLLSVSVFAQAPERTPTEVWNQFANDAREWATLLNSRQSVQYELNAREFTLWEKMKKEWPEVKKSVDTLYQ